MIWMGGCVAVPRTQTPFVDDDTHHSELCILDQVEECRVDPLSLLGILEMREGTAPVKDILAMEDRWFIWVVG